MAAGTNVRLGKLFILGANSFVGRSLFELINGKEECSLVPKNKINFLNPATFSNLDFTNATIVDCININNGNEEEIMNCNVQGFKSFCDYLRANVHGFKYVYVSTISVLSEESCNASAYVRSKKMAEDYLIRSGITYQIMRLSYPTGKGENNNRLISRLIKNLKENKPITIDDIELNLNNIHDVVAKMYADFLRSKTEFISNNNYVSLREIVFFLKESLASKSTVEIRKNDSEFRPMSEDPFVPSTDLKSTLWSML